MNPEQLHVSSTYRRSLVYQTADGGREGLVSGQLVSLDGSTNISLSFGLGTTKVTVHNPAAQQRTVTTTHPDGSQTVSLYTNGRLARVTRKGANGTVLTETTCGYDEYGRFGANG